MALALFIVYCLFLFRLTLQMLKFGERILGRHSVLMVAPVVACGAAISISMTLSGGILALFAALAVTVGAGCVFADEE